LRVKEKWERGKRSVNRWLQDEYACYLTNQAKPLKKHSRQKHMIAQDDNVAASSDSDIDICEKGIILRVA